jgi:hypothetical protein
MRKNLKQLSYLILIIFIMTFVSCGKDEPCDGNCPAGFICQDDKCIIDPNFNPCSAIICPTGKQCINGKCETIVVGVNNIVGEITANTTWTSDKIQVLEGKVYLKEGVTLTIQAGTIIKGKEGIGSLASALIIPRGSKLIAEGTAEKPIIFTSILDNIQPGQKAGTNLGEYDFGKWGGLIILGRAPISATNGDVLTQIEGIPGDVTYGKYGGSDVADNSGIMKFVSVRHGGALIGDGNEINGITLGGVGSGTVIENIEVVSNLDDGVEIFGGTVNLKNVAVGFIGDDAIDIDQNYSGTVDNFYIIHGSDNTDEALELDGPEGNTYKTGLFTLKNGTAIAVDQILTSAADLKAKCQGTLDNITFKGYKKGKHIAIRTSFTPTSSCAEKSDAFTNLKGGTLKITNCEFITSDSENDIMRVYTDSGASDANAQKDCLTAVLSSYEALVDGIFKTGTNKIVSNSSKGANIASFENWTFLAAKSKLQ